MEIEQQNILKTRTRGQANKNKKQDQQERKVQLAKKPEKKIKNNQKKAQKTKKDEKSKNQKQKQKKNKMEEENSSSESENEEDFQENQKNLKKNKNKKEKKQETKKPKALVPKNKKKPIKKTETYKDYGTSQYFSHFKGMDYKEARVHRAKTERIYLLRAERLHQNEWSFTVQGQSGKQYLITLNKNQIKCRCMDCRLRSRACKHIFFIVSKIAKNDKILNSMSTSLSITEQQYEKLDLALVQRLQKRIKQSKAKVKGKNEEKVEEQIDLGDDKDCPICFDEMIGEKLSQCVRGCKKFFHSSCIDEWNKRNDNCPLCRADWLNKDEQEDEDYDREADKKNKFGGRAMEKLQYNKIQINEDNPNLDDQYEDEDDFY